MKVFVKDPEPYLTELEISVDCAVNDRVRAQIDPALRTTVGYDLFFFSEAREKKAFDENIIRYCGALTDPVSKVRFRPGKKAPSREFAGREWFFFSDSTEAIFAAMPDSFLAPGYSMKPKAEETASNQRERDVQG